jgi:uncharacterized protein DUF4124
MRLMLFTICILSFMSSVSAKMYKWVDEEGNVTYSQTPPPEGSNVTKEDVKVSGQTLKPYKKGKYMYCGNYKLPRISDRPESAITMLEENIIGWRDQITNIKKQRGDYTKRNAKNYSTNSYAERIKSYDVKIKEQNCKLEWAKVELESLDDDRNKISEKYDNITVAIKELEEQKAISCGSNNYEGVVVLDDEAREYFKCIKKFDRELKKMKKQLRTAKKQKKMIENY